MFLTACCHACNPSNHLSGFRSSDKPPEASTILDQGKGRKKVCKTQKTLTRTKNDPKSQRCQHRFAVKFLLYKLRTYQIRTGLRSQMTSAIITNYCRSLGYTSPVRIGLLSIGKSCISSIHKLSLTHSTINWTSLGNHTIINTFFYPIYFHRLCHGLVGNFLIFTSCIAWP